VNHEKKSEEVSGWNERDGKDKKKKRTQRRNG
jgi:hypothetical protein